MICCNLINFLSPIPAVCSDLTRPLSFFPLLLLRPCPVITLYDLLLPAAADIGCFCFVASLLSTRFPLLVDATDPSDRVSRPPHVAVAPAASTYQGTTPDHSRAFLPLSTFCTSTFYLHSSSALPASTCITRSAAHSFMHLFVCPPRVEVF